MSSLIVFLCFLVLVIGIIAMLAKLNVFSKINMPCKIIKIIVAAYLGICILSLPVLYLLPTDSFNKYPETDISGIQAVREADGYFYDYLNNGNLTELISKYKHEKYQFPKRTNTLSFDIPNGPDQIPIWVEKKASDDGIIEAYAFTTRYAAANLDITNQVPPLMVSMPDDYLKIGNYKFIDIGLSSFDYTPYPISQFKKKSKDNNISNGIEFGVHAVYVRIPAGMSVDRGKNNVTIIGEQ